jgi:UDP-N-acetylglucosamine diphosphorylase/glucosamine-1-phosphate N-acetyltransferase
VTGRLVCLEPDDPGPAWEPFTGARPLAELRAGAWRIRERWAAVLGRAECVVMGNHAGGFVDAESVPVVPRGPVDGPAVVVRSDFAPRRSSPLPAEGRRLVHGKRTVGWVVPAGDTWRGEHDNGPPIAMDGLALNGAWELITALEQLLPDDCAALAAGHPDPVPPGVLVLGDPGQVACFGAEVEPGVVFDVRQGAVVLEEGVRVLSGTRLEGPLFIGADCQVLGGTLRQSALGPRCKVHGEVSGSVFLGFANKSHDGFIGHSVIGQWVNLGAGTITSNLKNTYGEVRLDLPSGRIPTGRLNLGTLFGDHVKTGIGTLFSTGTIVGTGAHVLGPSPARYVPPFTWGRPGERLDPDGFVTIARRVMPRRGVAVTAEVEASLRQVYGRLAR